MPNPEQFNPEISGAEMEKKEFKIDDSIEEEKVGLWTDKITKSPLAKTLALSALATSFLIAKPKPAEAKNFIDEILKSGGHTIVRGIETDIDTHRKIENAKIDFEMKMQNENFNYEQKKIEAEQNRENRKNQLDIDYADRQEEFKNRAEMDRSNFEDRWHNRINNAKDNREKAQLQKNYQREKSALEQKLQYRKRDMENSHIRRQTQLQNSCEQQKKRNDNDHETRQVRYIYDFRRRIQDIEAQSKKNKAGQWDDFVKRAIENALRKI